MPLKEINSPIAKRFLDSTGEGVYNVLPDGFNYFTVVYQDAHGGQDILGTSLNEDQLKEKYDIIMPITLADETKSGVTYIREERSRQIHVEGFSPEGDAIYQDGQLAFAAATYALPEVVNKSRTFKRVHLWPWAPQWWKPSTEDRIKELAKAGALIAAEIDRLVRAK